MLKYEQAAHLSDLSIIAYGRTMEELFENSAFGMFSLICDMDKVEPKEDFNVVVYADDLESLLISLLNDLVYVEDSKKVLLRDFKLKSIANNKAHLSCKGEKIDLSRHALKHTIKAATFSQLKIRKEKGIYSVQIVFDV